MRYEPTIDMDGTPRLRSAFPQTPRRDAVPPRDRLRESDAFRRRPSPTTQQKPLPQIPTLRSAPPPPHEPLIPEHIIDAPSQRLYAVALWVALLTWRMYDFSNLQDSEEQSFWLFMKWVAIDGVFLFGLPGLRIPWLEWSSATMTLIFLAHAIADGMLMFQIPIPIGAAMAVLWRGLLGVSELAVNEHSVNPDRVLFNDSLILGRQVIHILPEGSAVLNPERTSFCLNQTHTEAKIPIVINATDPISMEIVHVDLETQVNTTLHITKSQIKTMHKEASRHINYSDKPNEPKTLFYTVKKPGLYVLAKVVDATNLQVSRKKLAHTVVVPCPKAELLSTSNDKCRGELSDVELEVTGTPPMKVKMRKMVNHVVHDANYESIQPEDLVSPLVKADQNSLAVPGMLETEWARPRSVRVPLSEGLATAGRWAYAIDEVVDGFGNRVRFSAKDQAQQDRKSVKPSQHLHHIIQVHERPNVNLEGCTPQKPMKVAKGRAATLPLVYGSTGARALVSDAYHLEYIFTPQDDLTPSAGHGAAPQLKKVTVGERQKLSISEPGLYTLTGVSSDHCSGHVLEPASCLLQNPPEPQLAISEEEIFDKCAGSPIGLRVDLDLIGTPPFEVTYKVNRHGERHHNEEVHKVAGLRSQLFLTPRHAGKYTYEFDGISDAVYKNQRLKGLRLEQSVKPSASAAIVSERGQVTCIDQAAAVQVQLSGEQPFTLEWELIHNGKRQKFTREDISESNIQIETPALPDGGDYAVALVSITDRMGCKEFLRDEAKITVRHQKPKVGFGHIEARRSIDIIEGKNVSLPLRLIGEGPWTVKYLDPAGKAQILSPRTPNERFEVLREGTYELIDVRDNICPGLVDESANQFQVSWIPRPQFRITPSEIEHRSGNILSKPDVCEGDEDAVEVLFKGAPPYKLQYIQTVKPEHGAVAPPKTKDLRAAVNVASIRMETSRAGAYEYKLAKLGDTNYEHHPNHFTPISIQQKVNARPSAAFKDAGKTYSFCSVENEGDEVIPIKLDGQPPFQLEVEVKHLGTIKPEIIELHDINSHSHNIRIPRSRLHLGKSAVSLRRVSDARGCSRSLDSTTPRVQISVHDAPTITSLEERTDYCVGDRLNFGLSGVAPFSVLYTWNGQAKKAVVSSGNTFRRLAEKPGEFVITGLQDSASSCRASTTIAKHIHGMPSVRVSKGRDSYVDIHEGGEAEILFEFGGTPPFEFTYTRSANTEKNGKRPGQVLDMKGEVSEEYAMTIYASEEGTYEVVSIKDRHCSYAKPGVEVNRKGKKLLGY